MLSRFIATYICDCKRLGDADGSERCPWGFWECSEVCQESLDPSWFFVSELTMLELGRLESQCTEVADLG